MSWKDLCTHEFTATVTVFRRSINFIKSQHRWRSISQHLTHTQGAIGSWWLLQERVSFLHWSGPLETVHGLADGPTTHAHTGSTKWTRWFKNRVLEVRRESDVGDRGRIRREEIQAVFNQNTSYTCMNFLKNKLYIFLWHFELHLSLQ